MWIPPKLLEQENGGKACGENMADEQTATSLKMNVAIAFLNFHLTRFKSENAKIMLHKIFTGSIVLVWWVHAQVGHTTSIEAGKSLNLHYANHVEKASLKELPLSETKLVFCVSKN